MDDEELISIEPDDKVRYSNDSWNTEDFSASVGVVTNRPGLVAKQSPQGGGE